MSVRTFVAVVLLALAVAAGGSPPPLLRPGWSPSHVVRWSSDPLSNSDCTDVLYTEAARGPRSRRKALRAPPPADGKAIAIEGRRSDSANTKTINGRACVSQYVTSWDNMCNRSSHPEGHVCANASKAYEHYCSYDVGPTACATCNDWLYYGPKCLQPDVTISQGLCSGRTWSTSSCWPESVSVDWAGSQWAKHLGEVETAEECATWTKSLCDFVGGTVKTDACAPGGPYCDAMESNWHECDSDAHCAHDEYCCYSQAPRLESWSAKLCDGANVTRQQLVRPCHLEHHPSLCVLHTCTCFRDSACHARGAAIALAGL